MAHPKCPVLIGLWLCPALAWAGASAFPTVPTQLQPDGKPPPRALSVEALQAWYGKALDLKGDAGLARKVQTAEALVTALWWGRDTAKRRAWKAEILKLHLPPAALRAVVRHGLVPLAPRDKQGILQAEAPWRGGKGRTVKLALRIPPGYTHAHPWPLIVALHGTEGTGMGYLPHWQAGPAGSGAASLDRFVIVAPSAISKYGWGPSTLGRAQVWAAVDWMMLHYRIDPERIYLEGTSMGGGAVKRLGTLWPDRLAAIVPRSGPPLRPERFARYVNLHALPMLSLAGDRDPLIAAKHFIRERNEIEKMKLPAKMNIFKGRGHEVYHDKNGEVLAFFVRHTRQRAPGKLRYASLEDSPAGLRHYYVEIVQADRRGNQRITENVMDNGRLWHSPLFQKMQTARNAREYAALFRKAVAEGFVIEKRTTWMQPREVELHLDRKANAVWIERVKFVRQLRILLDDDVLDLEREVTVKLNGRIRARKKVLRSPSFLLDEMQRSGRRDVTFWGALDARLY